MAVSVSDIRDALSLGPAQPTQQPQITQSGPSAPRKSVAARAGVARELYPLIGDAAPPLVVRAPRFKQRPDLGRARARWALKPFPHAARSDGLQLNHWEKVAPANKTASEQQEYPFAKFSRPSAVYEYTDKEYEDWLEEPEWTKHETDYLMDLVKQYDSRFYVISDRYDYPSGGVERTIDLLKQRYFNIVRTLLRRRPLEEGESEKDRGDLIQTFHFDLHRETARKNYVRGLQERTPEQIAEEDALFLLCKKLEQTERRFARERETLLRHLAGIDSGLPNLPLDEEPFTALAQQQQQADAGTRPAGGSNARRGQKRKGDLMDMDSPSATPTVAKKIHMAKQAVDDEKHCIIRTDGGSLASTKSAHQAAYLRSQRIPVPKSSNANKVKDALTELKIRYDRLVMPTRDTCAQMESLLEAAGQLVEAKRSLDRVESEIRVMRQKRGEPVDVEMSDVL
ncbi:hypothetical protein BKA62DRAFT_643365 [Auriculariales sp. MPI-PUGE-AT-0066]|nr:hypothetical protein BKA62DRAFT_643365 [Auriculariales sp. MPI-PUGE-AT-0066]